MLPCRPVGLRLWKWNAIHGRKHFSVDVETMLSRTRIDDSISFCLVLYNSISFPSPSFFYNLMCGLWRAEPTNSRMEPTRKSIFVKRRNRFSTKFWGRLTTIVEFGLRLPTAQVIQHISRYVVILSFLFLVYGRVPFTFAVRYNRWTHHSRHQPHVSWHIRHQRQ